MNQRSLALASTVRPVDPPFLPEKPEPVKRTMLILVAGFVGCVSAFSFLLFREWMRDLQTPEQVETSTGLHLVAVVPILTVKNRETVQHRAAGELALALNPVLRKAISLGHTAHLCVMSLRKGEGKTLITELAVQRLRSEGQKVQWFRPETGSNSLPESQNDVFFNPNEQWPPLNPAAPFDLVVLEIPALEKGFFPAEWLSEADANWMVFGSGLDFGSEEKRLLDLIKPATGTPVHAVLNGYLL